MTIITSTITLNELKVLAQKLFGSMIKAVVDIERAILAVDAELHADLEALLLQQGSKPSHLWGINLYPERPVNEWIEFDALINLRPSQGNRSRGIENETIRKKIMAILAQRVQR